MKRLFNPLICTFAGLFNFIFMFLNYAAVFASQGSESESHGLSAYESLKFGDESLANILEELLGLFGKDAQATFLLVFVSILLISMIIISIGLLFVGCVGLVRECAGINLLGGIKLPLVNRISKMLMKTYFVCNIVAAGLLLVSCLINLYTGNIYGYKISLGLRPGIGMFFLLIFAIAEWIVFVKLEKKLLAQSNAVTATYQCSVCGTKATANDKFCSSCGSPVVVIDNASSDETCNTSSANTSTYVPNDNIKNFDYSVITAFFKSVFNKVKNFMKKKNISPKILYIAGGIVLFLIIAIIVLVNIPWPQAATYIVPEKNISHVYSEIDNQTIILSDGESTKSTIDGKITLSAQSLDGKTMALLSDEGTLFVYCNDALMTAGEYVESFKLSAEGTSVAYINDEGELVLYTIDDKKQKSITDELIAEGTSYYYLSPDGNSVAYVEGDMTDFILCVFSDGKRNEIEENALPLGLSDKAELIYYYSVEKDSIYVLNKDESPVKLINGISDSYGSVQLKYNAEHTQILFCTESSWYISDNGQEKQKISSKSITQFGNYTAFGISVNDSETIVTTPILDFKEQYFVDASNTLYYVNGKFEALEVASSVESFRTTAASSTVYYLGEYGELYRGEGFGKEFEMIADDVDYFVITSDGKKCYYVDYDDTLRYLKKANKSEKIADDIHSLYITHDDYAIFMTDYSYANGGTLYFTYNGKEKERISDDIVKVYATATSTYYYRNADEDGTYDVFGAIKKADFNLVAEEISN